ncbi:hypothetical protein G3I15_09470, partial [Streptomyces sp. SID10244]|nr:hypothetical protein [Streptomyces sp. SID10244]
ADLGTAGFDDLLHIEHRAALSRLDPAAGRLVEVTGLRPRSGGDGRLMVSVHHIAIDIVSWPVVATELATAWAQR